MPGHHYHHHFKLPEEEKIITVFDPMNKKGYDLRFGGENSEIYLTQGLMGCLERRTGATKRVFLCKRYLGWKCKSNTQCNSIHADRKRIAELRQENPVRLTEEKFVTLFFSPEELEGRRHSTASSQASSSGETDSNFLPIPLDRIVPSPASKAADATGVGEVCLLDDGHDVHCERCHLIPSYLRHIKSLLKQPCCAAHSPSHRTSSSSEKSSQPCSGPSKRVAWVGFRLPGGGAGRNEIGECLPLPPVHDKDSLAPTKGLRDLLYREGDNHNQSESSGSQGESPGFVLSVHPKMICRLHQKHVCKWGGECSKIHVCRKILPPVFPGKHPTPPPQCTTSAEDSVEEEELDEPPPLEDPETLDWTPGDRPPQPPTPAELLSPSLTQFVSSFNGGLAVPVPPPPSSSLASLPSPPSLP